MAILGVPRKMYEKEKDIIPIKEKFRQKGIKTKKYFFENLANVGKCAKRNSPKHLVFEGSKNFLGTLCAAK